MRRIMIWLIALLLLALPLGALADDTIYSQEYLQYKIEDGGITIVGYVGDDEETVVIPNNLAGYPVSKIAAGSFANCPQVKTLYLPDTIMEIEEGAIALSINVVRDYNLSNDPVNSAEPIENRPTPTPQTGVVVQSGENTGVTVVDITYLDPVEDAEDPIEEPTEEPTAEPTAEPTPEPTDAPADTPKPTDAPVQPTDAPSKSSDDGTITTTPVTVTEQKSGSPWGWIAAGAALAGAVVAGVVITKKKKK